MSNWQDRFIVIDTETTGLHPTGSGNPEEICRIVELGAVLFERGQVTEKANWLLNPGCSIPPRCTKVHGISDEMVKDAPRFGEILPDLREMAEGAVPVAYNAPFDKRFFHSEVRWATRLEIWSVGGDMPVIFDRLPWLDPLVWARKHMKATNYKLGTIADAIGLDLEAHQAEHDAEATGKVLWALRRHLPENADDALDAQQEIAHGAARHRFTRGARTRQEVETYECDACFAVEHGEYKAGKWDWPKRWAKFKPKAKEPFVTCSVGCELLLAWWDGQDTGVGPNGMEERR